MIATLRALPRLETGLLLVAIVLVGAFGAFKQRAAETAFSLPDSYSTHDASSGGYRAWFELLQREGIAVERFERAPAFLTERVRTLVWADPLPFDPRQPYVSKADIAALEHWVRAGGTLIYLGHDDAAARQKILRLPLSIKPKRATSRPATAPFLREAGVRAVRWRADRRWKPRKDAEVLVGDKRGLLAVRYAFGRGSVTAIVDEAPFANSHIADADAARFAYALLARAPSPLAFDEAAHGFIVPLHWWTVVPRAFTIGLIVALVTLAVAFTGAAIRLGPPIVPRNRRDATSAEFLDAVAALLARGRAADGAVTSALHSTARAVTRSLGLPDDAPPRTIAARLDPELRADYTRLLEISAAGAVDDKTLVRALVTARHLRKECASHGRPRN